MKCCFGCCCCCYCCCCCCCVCCYCCCHLFVVCCGIDTCILDTHDEYQGIFYKSHSECKNLWNNKFMAKSLPDKDFQFIYKGMFRDKVTNERTNERTNELMNVYLFCNRPPHASVSRCRKNNSRSIHFPASEEGKAVMNFLGEIFRDDVTKLGPNW